MSFILSQKIKESQRPFIIAGPCSAENESQIENIVAELAKLDSVSLIRAGIWKPRTRPDSFEGIGEIGLKWLANSCKKHDLPSCVEVANAKHVQLALDAGISSIWIGARTTVNPFTVQEIVDSLKGVNIPILIKNPVNPDINLWIGAFERFLNSGFTDLTAIHRGFSVYKHPKYRNVPSWEIPIGFKQILPEIPLICDPSHITGKKTLIQEVSQKAMDLNFNGLMIECHPNPDEALSDKAQQLNVQEFREVIKNLILREKNVKENLNETLNEYRNKISSFDDQLFEILQHRMKLSEEVGDFKRNNNITILQEQHWKNVIDFRISKSEEYHLSQFFIKNIMDNIHQESIRHQAKVMNPIKNKK